MIRETAIYLSNNRNNKEYFLMAIMGPINQKYMKTFLTSLVLIFWFQKALGILLIGFIGLRYRF